MSDTPFGFATANLGISGMARSQVVAMLKEAKPMWPNRTPVRMILRPKNDSDTTALARHFPEISVLFESARKRKDLPVAATDQDNADLAESMEGSLVTATLTQLLMEKRKLRLFALDGVEPSLENYESHKYPYGKSFYFVFQPDKNETIERFVKFLSSAKGRAALREAGCLARQPL